MDTAVLPVKWIELICVALNAACTHRNEAGVRRHVLAALQVGVTAEEIRETLKGASVLGIHAVAASLPILFEDANKAGVQAKTRPPGEEIDGEPSSPSSPVTRLRAVRDVDASAEG